MSKKTKKTKKTKVVAPVAPQPTQSDRIFAGANGRVGRRNKHAEQIGLAININGTVQVRDIVAYLHTYAECLLESAGAVAREDEVS